MLAWLKRSFDAGIEKIRLLASITSERLKVEVAVIKLLLKTNDLEKTRGELAKSIGERVFELRGRPEANILSDARIKRSVAEMEKVVTEINDIKSKASEIGKAEG
jgi:hypothetical protein